MAGKKKAGKAKRTRADFLNPMEEAFCREWLMCGERTAEAYRRAGYQSKSPNQDGHKLLKRPKIQKRIAELREDVAQTVGITPHLLAKRYLQIALGDMRQLGAWGPTDFIPFFSHGGVHREKTPDGQEVHVRHEGLSDDVAATIAEVSIRQGQFGPSIKIKQHDPLAAGAALERLMGWIKNDVETRAMKREQLQIERERLDLERRKVELAEKAAPTPPDGAARSIILLPPDSEDWAKLAGGNDAGGD